jgi:hypothetical protein
MDVAPDSSPGWCLVIACFLLAIGQADIDDAQPLHRFNHRERWPCSVNSFFPHGPARTLQGAFQWLEYKSTLAGIEERCQLVYVIDFLLRIAQPLIIPHLVVAAEFFRATDYLRQIEGVFKPIQNAQSNDEHEHDLVGLVKEYVVLMDMLDRIVFISTNEAERKVFHRTSTAELVATYKGASLVAYLSSKLIMRHRVATTNTHSHSIFKIYDMVDNIQHLIRPLAHKLYLDCPDHSAFDLLSQERFHDMLDLNKAEGSPSLPGSERLLRELSFLDDSQRCSAPACLYTMAECRLRLCMGCLRFKYCSRRCQKRVWTHSQARHRTSCAMLADVVNWSEILTCASETEKAVKASLVLDYLEESTILKLETLNPGADIRH